MKATTHLLLSTLVFACASPAIPPYSCGPTMNQKGIKQVFQPIIDYMDLKSGDTFADVGASSGGYTVMMATLLENTTIYVQDIDTTCVNEREFNKVIDYYSLQSRKPLRNVNSLHLTVGEPDKTNLPEGAFDAIYTNGTFHLFNYPDKMVLDLYSRLKPDGALYVRDNFSTKKQIQYCVDKKCSKPLVPVDTFLSIMARNKFRLEKSKVFSGYPIYKFTKFKI